MVWFCPEASRTLVALRGEGRFRALIEAGHTPATRLPNFKARVEHFYLTDAHIAAFHRRFVAIPTLVAESGRQIPDFRAIFARAGIAVFALHGQDFWQIFLWKAAETALTRKAPRFPSTSHQGNLEDLTGIRSGSDVPKFY